MVVYRVEKRDFDRCEDIGPYRGGDVDLFRHHFSLYQCQHKKLYHRPTKQCDQLDWDRFAFPSLKKLNRWFTTKDKESLIRAGYSISVYLVDGIKLGKSKKQCTFTEGRKIRSVRLS